MLFALTIRSILVLRIMLMTAQSIFIYVGYATGNPILLFWNVVFILINLVQVIILYRQRRPVHLPEGIQDIYESAFSPMSKREFLYFWQMAKPESREAGARLIKEGQHQNRLLLITRGEGKVIKEEKEVAHLIRGNFIAEMSFLSGKTASADVFADTDLEYVYWEQSNLDALQQLNPKFYTKVHTTLSLDVVKKLQNTNSRFTGTIGADQEALQRM